MMKSLLCNRWPVAAILLDETVKKKQYSCLDLSSKNWVMLEEFVNVLHPIEVATTFLSKEYNCSLSVIFPVIYSIVSQLMTTNENEAELSVIG
jgi:hypothetical protein